VPAPKDFGVPVNTLQQLSITYASATAALAGQLVWWDGQLATSPAVSPMGLLVEDAAQNKTVVVAMAGLGEGLSGGAIAIGQAVGTDGTGKLVALGAGNHTIGRAMSATTAANQKFQVYITREGTN
jgi:Uncharacterized conserved protein (DUF2190)